MFAKTPTLARRGAPATVRGSSLAAVTSASTTGTRYDPFRDFPPELHLRLRPYLDDIMGEVSRAIRTEIPEYARPADDTYMRSVQQGVEQAVRDFLARMADPGVGSAEIVTTYQRIGRGEAVEGRSLDAFHRALRLGARVHWRRLNDLADAELLPRPVLATLGEALFLHLDEIAAAATSGYTEERLHAAGEVQRRRDRLIDMLTADIPPSPEAVAGLARTARWDVPREMAVVATGHGCGPEAVRRILPAEFLARFDQNPGRIIVPDPGGPGRAQAIVQALRGMQAAVGPTVTLAEGARSLRWASEALELAERGVLPSTGVVHCTEHLAELMMFRDEALVDSLAQRHLLPLEDVRPPQRERLAETLLSWLQCGHNASEVAKGLAVHPQTVRYRLRQLEELFGDRIRDPATQFEMQLALRARRLRPAT